MDDQYSYFPSSQGRVSQRQMFTRNISSRVMGQNSVSNSNIIPQYRANTAVVATNSRDGDYTDIQAALTAVGALGGGTVFVKAGTYYPLTKLTIPSNTNLVGENALTTIIDFSNAQFAAVIYGAVQAYGTLLSNIGTFSISNGSSTVTGSSTQFLTKGVQYGDIFYINNTPYTVLTVASDTSLTLVETFQSVAVSGASVSIVRPAKNIHIEQITVQNAAKSGFTTPGIDLNYVYNASVNFCISKGNNGGGITVTGFQIDVSNNVCFSNTNSSQGINISGNAVIINHNYCFNNVGWGIAASGAQVVIANNICNNNSSHGYDISGNDITATSNIAISNNLSGFFVAGGATRISLVGNISNLNSQDGIKVFGSAGSPTSRVVITGNSTFSNTTHGLEFTTNTSSCVATNNSFNDSSPSIDSAAANTLANNV